MERIDSLNQILSSKKAKYIIGTILLSGIGVALIKIFHIIGGATAGATFLPMHIAVLIAALTFGIASAIAVGGSSIVLSYLLMGMPALARLPYMLIELTIYAVLLGILSEKFNTYISLVATMLVGRIIYVMTLYTAINILGFQTYGISVIESIKTGIPGLVIQLICVPCIAKITNERLNLKND